MKLNKRIKITKHFFLDEFFPKETYLAKEKEELIVMIDPVIPAASQLLRNEFGPAIANNWWYSNLTEHRNYAGWRPKTCTVGALKSTHKEGKAVDLIFANASAYDVRDYILKNDKRFFDLGIRRLEQDVDWVHMDTKGIAKQKTILFFHK
jgi:hypothetical protein